MSGYVFRTIGPRSAKQEVGFGKWQRHHFRAVSVLVCICNICLPALHQIFEFPVCNVHAPGALCFHYDDPLVIERESQVVVDGVGQDRFCRNVREFFDGYIRFRMNGFVELLQVFWL